MPVSGPKRTRSPCRPSDRLIVVIVAAVVANWREGVLFTAQKALPLLKEGRSIMVGYGRLSVTVVTVCRKVTPGPMYGEKMGTPNPGPETKRV